MTLDLFSARVWVASESLASSEAPEVPVLVGSLCIALVPFIASTKMSILSKSKVLGNEDCLREAMIARLIIQKEQQSSLASL